MRSWPAHSAELTGRPDSVSGNMAKKRVPLQLGCDARGTVKNPFAQGIEWRRNKMGTELNATELSPKAEVPTCVFGFFEIFEVVPGAGLGEGKGNRRGTQMNADEF